MSVGQLTDHSQAIRFLMALGTQQTAHQATLLPK